MDKDLCFYIGYFSKVIGHKGEIGLRLDVDDPNRYHQIKIIFVQINERDRQLVPFSVHGSSLQNNGIARLQLDNIHDAGGAKALVGKAVFLPLEMLPPLNGNQFYFHEITGFKVIDAQYGPIGSVREVLEYPHQAILSIVNDKEQEILVPINDETITAVDRKEQILSIAAPEGLIELYLNN